MVSNKMAEGVSFVRPPVPLEISTGNPAYSCGKWKQKFDIYRKAIGAAKKPDETKVGLLFPAGQFVSVRSFLIAARQRHDVLDFSYCP